MIISQEKHIEFYNQQIEAQENEWKEYAKTSMNVLAQEKKMFFGEVVGVENSQGNVILRFKTGQVPRMKQHYFLGFLGSDAPTLIKDFVFSYVTFRTNRNPRYYSGVSTDIITINYWKTEDIWSYILVSGFDLELLHKIKVKFLNTNKPAKVVVAKKDPPIEYLKKLKEFIVDYPMNNILNLNLDTYEKNWSPKNLDNTNNINGKIIKKIDQNKVIVIQGPPGTGKTYLAAEICNYYLNIGNSVCVTALTNRALMEVALKEGAIKLLKEGRVYKTNLTSTENKQLINLKNCTDISPNKGDLLLSTYYKLATRQSNFTREGKRFNLMIIEEASQAFLATIAMFSSLAEKIIIIGDHKQLYPTVLKEGRVKEIFPRIDGVINGLKTFAFNNNEISYRLTKTRRLTSDSANLTGLFYNNTLSSISDLEGKTKFKSKYRQLFHPNGGVTIAKLGDARIGFSEKDIFKFIAKIASDIYEKNDKEIAILSPYIDAESSLYEAYSLISNDFKNVTISTIQKIQGLTSDFTIIYLPLRGHDLDDNLFNVATSRAKYGTLIVTYENIELSDSASIETKTFINQCYDVSEVFLNELKY